jgi:hypothetical protein
MEVIVDNAVLKKRLSTFKAGKSGVLRQVADEVVLDVLRAWENWPGTSADLYRDLGLSKMQMSIMIKKGKSLIKKGMVPATEDFKEVKIADQNYGPSTPCSGIEVSWDNGKLIRFQQVELLIDFLKKAA